MKRFEMKEIREAKEFARQGGQALHVHNFNSVMLEKIHSHLEAWLILIAAKILMGRNFARSTVTSRADNNTMWYMGEKLQAIAARIKADYPGFEAVEQGRAADGAAPCAKCGTLGVLWKCRVCGHDNRPAANA